MHQLTFPVRLQALARAVYANAPILLLDDVLRWVSASSTVMLSGSMLCLVHWMVKPKSTCSTHCLGLQACSKERPSLLPRIIVCRTKNLFPNQMLTLSLVVQHLTACDWLFVLDHGKISHQGTYQDIKASGYDFVGVTLRPKQREKPTNGISNDAEKPQKKERAESTHDDTEDDETSRTYDFGSWAPYKFLAINVGIDRVMISALLITMYSAVRLGTQVRMSFRCRYSCT